jgi:hypothetical protein
MVAIWNFGVLGMGSGSTNKRRRSDIYHCVYGNERKIMGYVSNKGGWDHRKKGL